MFTVAQISGRDRSTFCPIMIFSRRQQNSIKYDRAGSLAFLPGVLHHLYHGAAHGLRRLILHLPRGVGVGAEGVTPF